MTDKPKKIFIGYDERQSIAYTALQQSIIENTLIPVSITPLILRTLPIDRHGLTPFTYSRFLVPWLCDYLGWALFMDIDMLVQHDINDLFKLTNENYAAMVVDTKIKFERASMMLFNCGHPANKILTPEFIQTQNKENLHEISWLDENKIGFLPPEWNHIVGHDKLNPEAKLVHFTEGVPVHKQVGECEYAEQWKKYVSSSLSTKEWNELMGNSVWTEDLGDGRKLAKINSIVTDIRNKNNQEVDSLFNLNYSRKDPSETYIDLNNQYMIMHNEGSESQNLSPEKTFDGHSLMPHVKEIHKLISKYNAKTILDYGSGKGLQYKNFTVFSPQKENLGTIQNYWGVEHITCYDVGVKEFSVLPDIQYDGVICTDVLEHCPLEDMPWIIDELFSHANLFLYANIANYPALKLLPNGMNAHITIRNKLWWQEIFNRIAFNYPNTRYVINVTSPCYDNDRKMVSSYFCG